MLRQEKKHLQTLFSNIEADVVELEEDKTRAETKSLIFDIKKFNIKIFFLISKTKLSREGLQ